MHGSRTAAGVFFQKMLHRFRIFSKMSIETIRAIHTHLIDRAQKVFFLALLLF